MTEWVEGRQASERARDGVKEARKVRDGASGRRIGSHGGKEGVNGRKEDTQT